MWLAKEILDMSCRRNGGAVTYHTTRLCRPQETTSFNMGVYTKTRMTKSRTDWTSVSQHEDGSTVVSGSQCCGMTRCPLGVAETGSSRTATSPSCHPYSDHPD